MGAPSLYVLSNEYRELSRMLETIDADDGGDFELAIRNTLEGIEGAIQQKAPNVALAIAEAEIFAANAAAEAERLAARGQRAQKRANAMRAYLLTHMLALPEDKQRIKEGSFDISVRKNPPSVEILPGSEKSLPPELLRDPSKVEISPDVYRAMCVLYETLNTSNDRNDDAVDAALMNVADSLRVTNPDGPAMPKCPPVQRQPDKKKITDNLKARKDLSELEALAVNGEDKLKPADRARLRALREVCAELPKPEGCRLLQGFRLEIK